MRLLVIAVALSLATSSLEATVWFDPPNPTSRIPVTAHVTADWESCAPRGASVTRQSNAISITLDFDCSFRVPALAFDHAVDLGVLPAGVYSVTAGPGPGGLLVTLGTGTLTVQDASSPLQITPNILDVSDEVTIHAAGIAPVCAVAPCPGPQVFFGDREAQVRRAPDTDTVVVIAPHHDPGTVDVTVRSFGRTIQSIASVQYRSPFGVIDPAFLEPVLLPVAISGEGAFGSRWTTELALRNENDFPFSAGAFDNPCMPVCDSRLQPRTSRLVRPNLPVGQLIYVPRQAAPNLFFSILVRDLSRQSEALGTEIPVVREKDFFDRPFTIVNVPSDERYRLSLRLYRIDGGNTLHLRVRALEAIEGYGPSVDQPVLVDTVVPLALNLHSGLATGYIGDLLTTFPQLRGKGALRVEIDGVSKQRASWAFVSVTNNATQHVAVISPQ